jgi:hypothetical protein
MKHTPRILLIAIISVLLLTTSCKQTTRVCLLDTIENVSGLKSTYQYDNNDRLTQVNSYDVNGSLLVMYKLYYHNNGSIDHVDIVTGYNLIVERYQAVFNFNDQVGSVYYLFDEFGLSNPTSIGGHANIKYDASGEIDSCIRYNDANVIVQAFDITYSNGNVIYTKDLITNTESFYTYDNHGGGRTALHAFYKLIMPYTPLASINNCLTREVYIGGLLDASNNYVITYNNDGLAETIDDDQFMYTCMDRE